MSRNSFHEKGSNLLTPDAFQVVLNSALKRAVRSRHSLTLVVVEARLEWEGMTVNADDDMMREVAGIIGREIRDTDVLGHTDEGTLALVLLDTDFEHSTRVIDRVVPHIEDHEFSPALRIKVGAACYPTHAVDVTSLKRQALSHPPASWRLKQPGHTSIN